MITASVLALIVTALQPISLPADPEGGMWRRLSPGLDLRTMDGGTACRKGDRRITIVRVDPDRWRLDVFHQSEFPKAPPADVDAWQRRTGAAVVFNAGQYYPNRRPMGLFVKQGRNLGTPRLRTWKGLLVAEPGGRGERRRLDLIDLDLDPFDLAASPFQIAVQSFMILDREGKKRVRRSDWHANRTVVATDRRGRFLVLHTEGAYTLWDLADWLDRSDLGARHAMSLDGGFEAQICIRAGGVEHLSYGRWHVDDRGDHSLPGVKRSLPAVIGLFPR